MGVTSVRFGFAPCWCSVNSAHQNNILFFLFCALFFLLLCFYKSPFIALPRSDSEQLKCYWGNEGGWQTRGQGVRERGRQEGLLCSRIQSPHKLWMCSRGKHSISKCHMVLSQGIQLCACAALSLCPLCAGGLPCDPSPGRITNHMQKIIIVTTIHVCEALADSLRCSIF